MKHINLYILILAVSFVSSCDYFESPDDTQNVSEGFITHPSLILDGNALMLIEIGSDYVDPGFTASLGTTDISGDVVVSGDVVDPNTAGIYTVSYLIETVNELGDAQQVTVNREVIVRNSEVAFSRDLSGQYQGSGFGSDVCTVTMLDPGHYMNDKALASGNNIGVEFYDDGAGGIHIPNQSSRFGDVNSTAPGAGGMLNDGGFEWLVSVGSFGVFGPINYAKL